MTKDRKISSSLEMYQVNDIFYSTSDIIDVRFKLATYPLKVVANTFYKSLPTHLKCSLYPMIEFLFIKM